MASPSPVLRPQRSPSTSVPSKPSSPPPNTGTLREHGQTSPTPLYGSPVAIKKTAPPPRPSASPIFLTNKKPSSSDLNGESSPRELIPPARPQPLVKSAEAPAGPPDQSSSPPQVVRPNRITSTLHPDRPTTRKALYSILPASKTGSVEYSTLRKQIREFPIQFMLPGGQTRVLQCKLDDTVANAKLQIHREASKLNLLPIDHYVLKTVAGDGYLQDTQLLGEIPFVEQCRLDSTVPKMILIEKAAALTKKEKIINKEVGSLIGTPMSWTNNDNEISQFRKSMKWVRYLEKQEQKKAPSKSTSQNAEEGPKMMVKLRLPLIEATLEKTVATTERQSANKFLEQMFQKHYEKPLSAKGVIKKPSNFVLKATGWADLISGDQELISFDYIKNCLATGQTVCLSLVECQTDDDNELYTEDFPDEEFLQDPVIRYNHEEIKSAAGSYDLMTHFSLWDLPRPFRVKLVGVENVKSEFVDKFDNFYMVAGIYHGGELLTPTASSGMTSAGSNPRWYEWVTFTIQMWNLPRAARICFTLYGKSTTSSGKDEPLGWVNCQLVDYKHELRMGLMSLNMWPDAVANPIGTCVGNSSQAAATLFIEFETFALPVIFPTEPMKRVDDTTLTSGKIQLKGTEGSKAVVDRLAAKDPLYPITESDKKILWADREYCKLTPRSLAKFVMSVAHNDRISVQIMHELLSTWTLIEPVDALELLDSKFGDSKVRAYAIKCLNNISDEDLGDYLLQLIQVLKYEPYHDSALARFLLRRGLRNRRIGHSLFWFLRAEMHVSEISERYGLLLEAYLRGCGNHRKDLHKQAEMLIGLVKSANIIKELKNQKRLFSLQEELAKIQFQGKIQLPLNPSVEVSGIKIEKCKYMDSKKLPLWVVFNNADPNGPAKYVIFKSGDDLRQDMLTLQMIRLMDKLWKDEGLDLKLNPYGCISTGDQQGFIEVVLNSNTIANITRAQGGATAAFKLDPLANWLRENNPTEHQWNKAVENFILSCAGYCVATYVLGVGDRHNDNVMITKDGKFFHIDFGHFLGNFKEKFGVKRERAPFVFTPDFAHVMGGKNSKDFNKFVDICCKAYNILRKNANVFINLFAMMLSTGIPELTSIEDISYLREAFSLDANDEDAKEKFKKLIYVSLATITTQFNYAFHIWAH